LKSRSTALLKQPYQSAFEDSEAYKSDYKGTTLTEFAQLYQSASAVDCFGIKGYKVPIENKQMHRLGERGGGSRYRPDSKKKARGYIQDVLDRAK
jgi:hypothetical protein